MMGGKLHLCKWVDKELVYWERELYPWNELEAGKEEVDILSYSQLFLRNKHCLLLKEGGEKNDTFFFSPGRKKMPLSDCLWAWACLFISC